MKNTLPFQKIITLLAIFLLPLSVSSVATAQAKSKKDTSTNVLNDSSTKGKHHQHQRWNNLTKQERKELKSALKSVKKNPEYVAAKKAVKDAPNKKAKRVAQKALRQLRHDLLLKQNPSLEAVLAILHHAKR